MEATHITELPVGGQRPAGVPATPVGRAFNLPERRRDAALQATASRETVSRTLSTVRVLLAGGAPLMRANLSAVLGTGTGIAVVGEAATDDETIALARQLRPDVVLIDNADGLHVFSTTRRLLGDPELPGIQVLMLGRFEREEDVLAAMRSGIAGLIDRDAPPYELVRAVRLTASGAAFVVPSTLRRLIGRHHTRPHED
jgi:DNA-binding NarL/FixJ family response regulator